MGKYLNLASQVKDSSLPLEEIKREPLVVSSNSDELPWPLLNEVDREIYEEYVQLMTSEKVNFSREKAEEEALALVLKNKRVLQLRQSIEDYRRLGYVKIYSIILNQALYLAKDKSVARCVPDQSLPVFTEKDLVELDVKTLAPEELRTILECKVLFGGDIGSESKEND